MVEANSDVNILIVDDEQFICRLLVDTLKLQEMNAISFTEPLEALAHIKEHCTDVVLLDVRLNGYSGLDMIPEITKCCPSTKIIIMTGYADKETAIRALRLGAFEFLEKPLEIEILSHAIKSALEALEKERSVKQLIQDLKHNEAELLLHKERLEYLNTELIDTNQALSVLARNIERERDQMEKRIAIKLRSLIIPAIEKLRRDESLAQYEMELDMLVKQIEDVTTGFGTDAVVASSLSFTELRIASLIKNGLTSEDIAEQLHISPSTVRTHRKNIRKKLKINNAQYSLKNFLHSKDNPGRDLAEGYRDDWKKK